MAAMASAVPPVFRVKSHPNWTVFLGRSVLIVPLVSNAVG